MITLSALYNDIKTVDNLLEKKPNIFHALLGDLSCTLRSQNWRRYAAFIKDDSWVILVTFFYKVFLPCTIWHKENKSKKWHISTLKEGCRAWLIVLLILQQQKTGLHPQLHNFWPLLWTFQDASWRFAMIRVNLTQKELFVHWHKVEFCQIL